MAFTNEISPLLIDLVVSKDEQETYKLLAKQVQELSDEKRRIELRLTQLLGGMVIGEFEDIVELDYIAYTNSLVVKYRGIKSHKSNWLLRGLKFLRLY